MESYDESPDNTSRKLSITIGHHKDKKKIKKLKKYVRLY